MARYFIDEAFVQKYRTAIDRGEAVAVAVQDVENLSWLGVRAILSPSEMPGAERVRVYNFVSARPTAQEWYITVLEELGEDVDIPTSGEPATDQRAKI